MGHAKKKTVWTGCGRQPHDIVFIKKFLCGHADFLFMIFDFPGRVLLIPRAKFKLTTL